MEDELKRLDDLELISMLDKAEAARDSGDIVSQKEVKKRLNYPKKKK